MTPVLSCHAKGSAIVRLVLGSDHAGFDLKQQIAGRLRAAGYEVLDAGTDSTAPVDYPDFAERVGLAVCGSGVGASVAANKVRGVRACVCHDTYSAHQGVEHDDMNVLCLGARIIGSELAWELTCAFVGATFRREERFTRRLDKVLAIEAREMGV